MLRISCLVLVSMSVLNVDSQTINLTGKVTNSNGRPLAGAVVLLAGRNLRDTTDAQGVYLIRTGASHTNSLPLLSGGAEKISFDKGIVSFCLKDRAPVRIQIFDMKGNLLAGALDRIIGPGDYRFNARSFSIAAKIVMIRVLIGRNSATFRWLPSGGGARSVFGSETVAAPGDDRFAALQMVVDSLIVTASRYVAVTKTIDSYQGEVNITLDSIKLDNFSFFVTSLAGLQRLSGSQNGFGGDLRFGKTGPGAGLLGADSICECLAEASMPGSKVKQWRAFLSVAKGPDGKQVNAIERIGTGPWYDRMGRLVSNTISDLLHDRPNADPEIKNDLPNEDGIPNHTPDPTKGPVDNHQIITGSGTDGKLKLPDSRNPSTTCMDWTSASADAGKPSCGLSWPRNAGGGGRFGGTTGGGEAGKRGNWIYVWELFGCEAGIDLSESSMKGTPGVTTIGNGGGYGGFYCFALNP